MTEYPPDCTLTDNHTRLSNSFIALANKAGERHSTDFVASAIVAAAAAYTVFNYQVDGDEPDLDAMCASYRVRLKEVASRNFVKDREP